MAPLPSLSWHQVFFLQHHLSTGPSSSFQTNHDKGEDLTKQWPLFLSRCQCFTHIPSTCDSCQTHIFFQTPDRQAFQLCSPHFFCFAFKDSIITRDREEDFEGGTQPQICRLSCEEGSFQTFSKVFKLTHCPYLLNFHYSFTPFKTLSLLIDFKCTCLNKSK